MLLKLRYCIWLKYISNKKILNQHQKYICMLSLLRKSHLLTRNKEKTRKLGNFPGNWEDMATMYFFSQITHKKFGV